MHLLSTTVYVLQAGVLNSVEPEKNTSPESRRPSAEEAEADGGGGQSISQS